MRRTATALLTAAILGLGSTSAAAAPGWSDPVVVAPSGSDSGPLLAPLPGGRMLIADSTRPPMVNLEEGPSALRITLEADDGTFGTPRAVGPGSGALAAFAADGAGELAVVGMLPEGPVVYRGRFDGPLAATHSLHASGGYDIDVAPLAAGGALAGYVTPQGAAEVAVAARGSDFGAPHRLAEHGAGVRVATAADGSAVAAWTEGDFYETEVRAAWRGADGNWSAPQTVISNAQDAPAPLRLAAAGNGRAVVAANTGGILRVAVSDDHRFSLLTTFAQGDPADVGIDADGDAVLAWKGWTGPTPVLVSRLDAGRAQWGPSQPVGSCGAAVATAIDSHGTAVIALLDPDQDGLDDRLSAALWPRAGTLPQPQVLWDDPTVPTDIAVGTDDADRATIAFSGYGSTGRPLIAVRTAGSATDAAATAPRDPRLEPTNCRNSPGPPTPIPSVPPGPAPIMHSDRHARLVHGRVQLRISCPARAVPCSGSVRASAPPARWARTMTAALAPGEWRTVRLATTRRLRRMAAHRRLAVRIAVTSRLAGHPNTVTRRIVTL